jgi:hypothetical protein
MKTKKRETFKTDDERFKFRSYHFQDKEEKKEEFKMETTAFPELAPTTTILVNEVAKEKSFVNTLNKQQELKVELVQPAINSHWVTITHNKRTGRLTYFDPHATSKTVTEEQSQKIESKLVVRALTNLHMKRTKEFIDAWGKEEHYQTFYSTAWS